LPALRALEVLRIDVRSLFRRDAMAAVWGGTVQRGANLGEIELATAGYGENEACTRRSNPTSRRPALLLPFHHRGVFQEQVVQARTVRTNIARGVQRWLARSYEDPQVCVRVEYRPPAWRRF